MIKKGDTLIEVTLAVGIFSMIAIAIVAVMSNGVANAQTALESTLTREEIDSQAEALRFIHSSYIANVNNTDNRYRALWDAIVNNAIDLEGAEGSISDQLLLQYSPTRCEDLYDQDTESSIGNSVFIINTRNLGNDNNNDIIITRNSDNNSLFRPASTYPRLVYQNSDGRLVGDEESSLFSAEGIYILAVKDNNTTSFGGVENESAFYDFYIRTCWYGHKTSDASTISTVIRLYNPDIVSGSSN